MANPTQTTTAQVGAVSPKELNGARPAAPRLSNAQSIASSTDTSFISKPQDTESKKRSFLSNLLRKGPANDLAVRRGQPEQLPAYASSSSSSQLRIIVKTESTRALPFTLESSTALADLKQALTVHCNLPLHKMLLVLNSEPLMDDHITLGEYGIREGSTLYLIRFVQELEGLKFAWKAPKTEMKQMKAGGVHA